MTIPLAACIVGFIVWFVASRPKFADVMIAKGAEWTFLVGLFFTLAGVAGVKLF